MPGIIQYFVVITASNADTQSFVITKVIIWHKQIITSIILKKE